MNIDKDIIGKPPNQAIVINDKLINRQSKEKEDHSKDNKALSDSRERLEADVRGAVHGAYAYEDYIPEDMIFDWLDRQAAITEEKTRFKWVTASAEEIAAWRSKAEKLKEQVYELTAERDQLWEQHGRQVKTIERLTDERELYRDNMLFQAGRVADVTSERDEFADELKLDAIALDELRKQVDELTTERDHLKKVVQQQAESFRKMEVELSKAKAVSNECDR